MLSILSNLALTAKIARNSAEVFRDRYLTPAAQACYWRSIVKGWTEISFAPELWEMSPSGTSRMKGVPSETFM
jgi:hypothetical protein